MSGKFAIADLQTTIIHKQLFDVVEAALALATMLIEVEKYSYA
ncbi:hypothetical protein [Brasilonema bromeliae]|nr:hypothetical protein [Brasilonema bromeliae]